MVCGIAAVRERNAELTGIVPAGTGKPPRPFLKSPIFQWLAGTARRNRFRLIELPSSVASHPRRSLRSWHPGRIGRASSNCRWSRARWRSIPRPPPASASASTSSTARPATASATKSSTRRPASRSSRKTASRAISSRRASTCWSRRRNSTTSRWKARTPSTSSNSCRCRRSTASISTKAITSCRKTTWRRRPSP